MRRKESALAQRLALVEMAGRSTSQEMSRQIARTAANLREACIALDLELDGLRDGLAVARRLEAALQRIAIRSRTKEYAANERAALEEFLSRSLDPVRGKLG